MVDLKDIEAFVLLLFFPGLIACSSSQKKQWSIPLYSTNGSLEIELPIFFDTLKKSVHTTDCGDCGKFHTIITDKNFVSKIEETTGFLVPWRFDSIPKTVFYIEEQLYPQPFTKIDEKSMEDNLKNMIWRIASYYSNYKILKKSVKDGMAIISYETYDQNGLLDSKGINCQTYFNNLPIEIEFIQNQNFENDLTESVWNGIQKMRIIENK